MSVQGYQKIGLAVIFLAKKMMTLKVSDRIQTIEEYTQEAQVSRGTIQNAFRFLKDNQAISLVSKGHLGTFIGDMDYQKLWNLTEIGILTGAMPLPYSVLYEGLATGLYKAAYDYGIETNIAYVSGSKTRIDLLKRGRYDYVITSKSTADAAIEDSEPVKICFAFGAKTYLSEHVLLLADKSKERIEDGMRVGLDPTSIDMELLTKYACTGRKVNYVTMPYNQIVNQIRANRIDAGIWNYDEIKEKQIPVAIRPIGNSAITKDASNAVVLVRENETGISNFLKAVIKRETVLNYQIAVMKNEIMPQY